ncbi:MAG: SMC-Scp complex subunit ScpB [Proteobacteria bacterium]|jgi:segregation and condensation protein B|nr:MAG: SMC-Scp complex subunit ScpB [Pseudomonadota bacterium]
MINDEHLRMVEALLFASAEPLSEAALAERVPEGADVAAILTALSEHYAPRGVNLVSVAGKWMFRTAADLAFLLRKELEEPRRLSRAAVETLAIVAYHQPVTRAEIEEIRGVGLSKGTLDVLMEAGWVKPRGRKRTPGRPVTYGTSESFLVHFGLASVDDLPGIEELKAAGLLDHVNLGVLSFNEPKEEGEEAEEELPLEELPLDDLEGEEHETAAE